MNPEWIESLPKTPETENDNLSENEQLVSSNKNEEVEEEEEEEVEGEGEQEEEVEVEVEEEEEEEDEYEYDDDADEYEYEEYNNTNNTNNTNNNKYGSDNDDINSDDELYDVISMDEAININLTQSEIDKFHQHLYGYYNCTRASKKLCSDRYNILCLINDIWQKVLIQREFDKNNIDKNDIDIAIEIEEIFEDKLHYSAYKRVNCREWLTPLCAPKKRIRLINNATNVIIYDKIIPSARIFGSICTRLDCEGSDMDITLPNSVDNPYIDIWFNKNEQKSKLSSFLSIFSKQNKYIQSDKSNKHKRFEVFPVLNAKVPIIKIKDIVNGIEMDIAIESSQQAVANLINFYCDFDDRVRPFIISIKHWSKVRCLCDAMNNYPNSFGFVLLCIKFLQMVNIIPVASITNNTNNNSNIKIIRSINNNNGNGDTLLELLCQFFEMFHRFNFKLLQISTSRVGLESKICHEYYSNFKYNHQTTMVIEDPSCRSANVTRNVRPYRLTIMQNEFFRAYICVKNGNWSLFVSKYTNNANDIPIFNIYTPSDAEQEFYKKKIYSQQNTAVADSTGAGAGAGASVGVCVGGTTKNYTNKSCHESDDESDDESDESFDTDHDYEFNDNNYDENGILIYDGQYDDAETNETNGVDIEQEEIIEITTATNRNNNHNNNDNNCNKYVINKLVARGRGKYIPSLKKINNSNNNVYNSLQYKLNDILSDDDIIKIFIKLTPFKANCNEFINMLLKINEFLKISKFYIIQFNIQFIKYYYDENNNNNNNNKIFDILSINNKEIIKYNNNENWKIFLNEYNNSNEIKQQIMPYNLHNYIEYEYNLNNNTIYNYSWYISFISLYSFWNSIFDECNTNTNIIDQLSNKEWILLKIKNSMIDIGLTHLTEIQLFKLLK